MTIKSTKLSLLMIFITLSGCSSTQYYYTSEADIPHVATSTETVMNLMQSEESIPKTYGIVAATDDGVNNYILIAPTFGGHEIIDSEISYYNITEATYIDLASAKKFTATLKNIVFEWDNLRDDDGYFIEFSSAPEINVVQLDDSFIEYAPSVRFFFNVTDEGPTGVMYIEHQNRRSNEVVTRNIDMSEKNKIEQLLSLLDSGIKHFN